MYVYMPVHAPCKQGGLCQNLSLLRNSVLKPHPPPYGQVSGAPLCGFVQRHTTLGLHMCGQTDHMLTVHHHRMVANCAPQYVGD